MDAIRASVVVKRYVCSPAGTRRGNRAQTTPDASFGPRCVFFKLFFFVLLTTTAPNDADMSFGPFRRFGFHLPFHHHQRPAFTHYHVPATSHLTTHTSHHHHQLVTSPHPTATTRHVTSPTFSNRAGKTKKQKKKGSPATLFLFQVCFFP